MKCFTSVIVGLLLLQNLGAIDFEQIDLFVSGQDGYHTYRIPSVIVTKTGTVLAFCEGRKSSRSDAGDIDLLFRRSVDGGKTWSAQKVIWDDGANTCGNPCPVVDESTGTVRLLLTHNLGADKERDILVNKASGTRTVWITKSTDDGQTWSPPVEITSSVKDPSWGWYATGPGVGIQIKHGQHKGRLVIPCDHSYETKGGSQGSIEYGSHAIFSDDSGRTWKQGGVIRPRVNECQVVEIEDGKGTLLMNMRSYFGRSRRTHSFSFDGGQSWSDPEDHQQLIEPVCQASILRYSWSESGQKSRLLFSNPADEKRREKMTVRLSYDEAKTWPVAKVVHAGPSAYSCLAILPDGTISLLYEGGETNAYEKIRFARFSLDWLTDRKDSPGAK